MKKTLKLLSLLFILFALIFPSKSIAATSKKSTNKNTTSQTTTTSSTNSTSQFYKTKFTLVMRPEGNPKGKVIIRIPAKSIIQVVGKDSKANNRLIAIYNGKKGSILNSGLVKQKATSTPDTTTSTSTTITKTDTISKQTTSTTLNNSTKKSSSKSYKLTYALVMRQEGQSGGKVIAKIPAGSTVEFIKNDSKIKNKIVVNYNGKRGSIINSGLVKIDNSSSSEKDTKSANSKKENYKYYARTKAKSDLFNSNGKKIKTLEKNELIKVISISSEKAKVQWYDKTGFVQKNKLQKITNGIFISIEKQTLTFIRNSENIVTTSVVTGNAKKKDTQTPTGAFKITERKISSPKKPVVLKGANYSSPVDYWLRFSGNVGIHDASWREKGGIEEYGKNIYKTNGSHGCVNTPLKDVAKIYHYSYIGLPVYVQ